MTGATTNELPLVSVTGAAGRVGRLTAAALAGRYRLRLVDLEWPDRVADDPLTPAVDEADRVSADLRDLDAWDRVVDGADLLVHLAAQPSPEIGVREALEDVAMPTAHLVAAAERSSVRRVVFASSIHAMGLYDRHALHPVDPTWPPRPCCEYGAAKVLSENLLALLTERADLSVVCLRLGLTGMLPPDEYAASQWLGDRDFAELLRGALVADVKFAAYFGVSVRASNRWNVSYGRADLGYTPTDVAPAAAERATDYGEGHCLMRPPEQ
ncbi:MAG TPA: NAD(P)-dependent oxidoreductase [Propionibacteriaceae bacterium]|nr:NAD(P)-dependent oxidoreductase [Propionibacteriaceae bacterium]